MVKKKKKRLNSNIKNIILLSLSLFFCSNIFKELSTTIDIHKNLNASYALSDEIAKEHEKLSKQKEMFEDPNYLMNYVRGKLLITQEGEQIFSIED